ncbi:RNA-binding protein 34 [Lonchura striata]|uniref:RNA-binding protein 34 n=1 Tax=Lonchura striata TaxID=40157 RepID=A0A218VAQ9_9PASE|nr:RNA-binding protein 34 isoform X1 [Lonchura striata domestica]OWK63117.1 RNA-binding protein 34 [Lonchura striata domestica]
MGPRRRAAAEGQEGQLVLQEEQYVLGQVSGSLGATAAPLARLFRAAAPPVLVAVPRGKKKRKRAEEGEKVSEDQSLSNIQETPVKAKKARKKERSEAEKKLSERENALEQADEEEDQKLLQNKVKQKQKASRAKSVVNSATGATAKQQKRRRVADKAADRRTVFVGNLPVSCTVQVLTSLFKKYGQIQSIRFRSLIPAEDTVSKKVAAIKHKVHPNAKSINAYVVFKEECDAQNALKENGTEIASGFHIRVDTTSKTSSHDNKRSIFLGNLSYDIRDDAVREHFQVCGDIVGVRVVRDRRTGLGKGFGYVLFENTDAVHLALKLNNSVLMGRKIRVQRIEDKRKAQKSLDQSRAPKDRVDKKKKKEKSCSNDSFVGEKANPLKKSIKPKRPKTTPKSKAGKNKQSFDKK